MNDNHYQQNLYMKINLTITGCMGRMGQQLIKSSNENKNFKLALKKHNLDYGFRIGNRLNIFPFKDDYEIQRLDIKGEDSIFKFKLKIKFGKLSLL